MYVSYRLLWFALIYVQNASSLVSWQPALTPSATEVDPFTPSSADLLADLPLTAPEPPAVEYVIGCHEYHCVIGM